MKPLFLFPLLLGWVASLTAQETNLTIEVSSNEVKVGEVFTLSIHLVNAQGEIEVPDLNDFDIVSGPNYSSSFSMRNGQTEMSSGYSYQLAAQKEGQYTIASASVMVDGIELYTEPIVINVVYDPNYRQEAPEQIIPAKRKKKGIRL